MGTKKEYTVLVEGVPVYVGAIRTAQTVYEALLAYRKVVMEEVGHDEVPNVLLAFGAYYQ